MTFDKNLKIRPNSCPHLYSIHSSRSGSNALSADQLISVLTQISCRFSWYAFVHSVGKCSVEHAIWVFLAHMSCCLLQASLQPTVTTTLLLLSFQTMCLAAAAEIFFLLWRGWWQEKCVQALMYCDEFIFVISDQYGGHIAGFMNSGQWSIHECNYTLLYTQFTPALTS